MAIKVLTTAIGQQIIADTKQIEKKEGGEIVAYWLENPRTLNYNRGDDGNIGLNFGKYCYVSDETAFSMKESFVVTILEVRDDVIEAYNTNVNNESSTDTSEDGADTGNTDGSDGVRAESAPEESNASVGEDEVVAEPVA